MQRPGEAGLTLVEMLVVLAIIGVMAGATVLTIGSGGGTARTEAEARRLETRLELAADETMVTDRMVAFAPEADAYRFVTWDMAKGGWRPDPVDELGRRHALPSGMRLITDTGGKPLLIGADGGGGGMQAQLATDDSSWTIQFDGTGATASRTGQ